MQTWNHLVIAGLMVEKDFLLKWVEMYEWIWVCIILKRVQLGNCIVVRLEHNHSCPPCLCSILPVCMLHIYGKFMFIPQIACPSTWIPESLSLLTLTQKSYKILQRLSPKHAARGVAQSPYLIYSHGKACLSKQLRWRAAGNPRLVRNRSWVWAPTPAGALCALFSPPFFPPSGDSLFLPLPHHPCECVRVKVVHCVPLHLQGSGSSVFYV